MDLAPSHHTIQEEQEVIVKFFVLKNNKNHIQIHQQLHSVYGANTVSLDQVRVWFNCFVGLRTVKASGRKRVAANKRPKAVFSCLHTTEQPWRPSLNSNETNAQQTTDLVSRKILRILNKITETNYAILLEQLKSLPINTEDCLRKTVKQIMFYVRTEHKFSNLYARLCLDFSPKFVPFEKQIIGACPMYLTFNELVREGCKEELTLLLKEAESLVFLNDFKARFNLKGLTLFISELYNTLALPVEVVEDEYLKLLFLDTTDSKLENNLFRVECCYECLNSLGKFLDLVSSLTPPKISRETVDLYFKQLGSLVDSNNLPLFLRYKIRELIELRARDWVPRVTQEDDVIEKKVNDVASYKSPGGRRRKFFWRSKVNKDNEEEGKISKKMLPLTLDESEESKLRKANLPEEEKLVRKVRQCLNKITVNNFSRIVDEILTLPLESVLETVAALIVNKAVIEPLFSSLYADLCFLLSKKTCEHVDTDNQEDAADAKSNTHFKELIINECSKVWFSELEENPDKLYPYKWQILMKGISKFISELYWLGIINKDTVNSFVESILFNESKQTQFNLELLCVSLKYNGGYLDKDCKEGVDNYFKSIKMLYEKTSFPTRIRFMLLNLMELRECNWAPRLSDGISKPDNAIANKQPDKNRKSHSKRRYSYKSRQRSRQNTQQPAAMDKASEKPSSSG